MNQAGKKQQGFRMSHVFIILLFIMLFVVVLSYIIPSGSYQRLQDASGITVIDPNTFQYVENETPIGFMDYFEAIYTGFANGATIMGTLFISFGAIYLLEVSGAFGAGINLILKKTRGKEFSVVCIFYTIFVVFGVLGYGEAAYPFYPLAVTIWFALGYDRMVGTAFAILGSTVGFTSGLMNTFTTGVAQQIVGLPLFSGSAFHVRRGLWFLDSVLLEDLFGIYCKYLCSDYHRLRNRIWSVLKRRKQQILRKTRVPVQDTLPELPALLCSVYPDWVKPSTLFTRNDNLIFDAQIPCIQKTLRIARSVNFYLPNLR